VTVQLLLRGSAVNTELKAKVHEEGGDIRCIFIIKFEVIGESSGIGNFHEAFFRIFIGDFGQKFTVGILDGGSELVDIAIEGFEEIIDGDVIAAGVNGEFRFDKFSVTTGFKIF
jgi:hypothetical protein